MSYQRIFPNSIFPSYTTANSGLLAKHYIDVLAIAQEGWLWVR